MGEDEAEVAQSRSWARGKLAEYLCSTRYDYVYEILGVTDLVCDFRRQIEMGHDPWRSEVGRQLYPLFVCETSFAEAAMRLHEAKSPHVTGFLPTIMSSVRKLLPHYVVKSITAWSL